MNLKSILFFLIVAATTSFRAQKEGFSYFSTELIDKSKYVFVVEVVANGCVQYVLKNDTSKRVGCYRDNYSLGFWNAKPDTFLLNDANAIVFINPTPDVFLNESKYDAKKGGPQSMGIGPFTETKNELGTLTSKCFTSPYGGADMVHYEENGGGIAFTEHYVKGSVVPDYKLKGVREGAVDTFYYYPLSKIIIFGKEINRYKIGIWSGYDSIAKSPINVTFKDRTDCEIKYLDSMQVHKLSIEGYFSFKKFTRHGRFRSEQPDTRTYSESNYWFGRPIGKSASYKRDQVVSLTWYVDSLLEKSVGFNSDERGYLSYYYGTNNSGFSEGIDVRFQSNGEMKSFGHYDDGIPIGEWQYFHKNGAVASRGYYLYDYIQLSSFENPVDFITSTGELASVTYPKLKLNFSEVLNAGWLWIKKGNWYYYDESGSEERVEVYENGTLVKVKSATKKRKQRK